MGACDLVLVDAPQVQAGTGFTAHIRTRARYEYSYIERAAIKLGDDVLEVSSFGTYIINGVQNADLPFMLNDKYPVTFPKNGEFEYVYKIAIDQAESVIVKASKDLVSIKFDANKADFRESVGLMGQWETGTHFARDGKTVIEDDNEFGQEWQVRPDEPNLFMVESGLRNCVLPMPQVEVRRRLGEAVSTEAAEVACAHFKDEGLRNACVYDVIATGDLEVAHAGVF